MKLMDGNLIFNLDDSEHWVYRVKIYLVGLSQLQIEANKRDGSKTLYINFGGVEFYDGPLYWSGKNLQEGNSNECFEIVSQLEAFKDYDVKTLRDTFRLFVVERDKGYRIRIIARVQPTISEENLFSNYVP